MLTSIFNLSHKYFPNGYFSCEGSPDRFTVTVGMLRNICEVANKTKMHEERINRFKDPLLLIMEVSKVGEHYSLNVLVNSVRTTNNGQISVRRKSVQMAQQGTILTAIERTIKSSAKVCSDHIKDGTLFGQGLFPAKYYNIVAEM